MNDFTKDELQDIYDCLYYENKESEEKYYEEILNKVEVMIENFCDHEENQDALIAIPQCVCHAISEKKMIISERQIISLMNHLRDFIEDNACRSCIDEPAQLLLEIENQQPKELKYICNCHCVVID